MAAPNTHDIRDKMYNNRPGMHTDIIHRLILIRHGETTANEVLMACNKAVPPHRQEPVLTVVGKSQGVLIYKHIAEILSKGGHITSVEISPLLRAFQTAELSLPILREHKVPIRIDMNLCEVYNASETHHPYIQETPLSISHMDSVSGYPIPPTWERRPETFDNIQNRVDLLIGRWKRQGTVDRRELTVVFTHSLLISALLKRMVGSVTSDHQFHLSNGSISVVDIMADQTFCIHTVNHTNHLDGIVTGHHTPYTY